MLKCPYTTFVLLYNCELSKSISNRIFGLFSLYFLRSYISFFILFAVPWKTTIIKNSLTHIEFRDISESSFLDELQLPAMQLIVKR